MTDEREVLLDDLRELWAKLRHTRDPELVGHGYADIVLEAINELKCDT